MTLRRFLRWSEDQAAALGLPPAQHQLLVAIKGHPGPKPPAIRDLAEYLYPAATVLLARVVLGERLRWVQRAGLGLAAIGIILVTT